MILSYLGFEFEINFDDVNIVKLNIENKRVLKEIIFDFIYNLDESEGNIIFYESNSILKPSNYIYVFNDFFDLEISKNYLTKYYKVLNKRVSYEHLERFNILQTSIHNYVKEIVLDENFDLEFDEITNLELFKLVGLKLKYEENILLNIMENMKFINEILSIEIFVLINPEIYFSKEELDELYKFSLYSKFKIIIISSENNLTTNHYIDKIISIDEDLCEIF
ncbi:type II-A CRISPR-associated protein Csn2 [Oceanivirga miroungae]|uniref:Uncharacterized protein n=1 Tax=Oceanivirga miroungae TaxID=1130046 RepID=A0A6I8MB10_9FUSO|nr:type II-A CRISPR-associated protein Csn2 [Oceanivirga miroungae]VWL85946.1 hypothetical protein OMES3154_01239 [Oceanivirga miroungae]